MERLKSAKLRQALNLIREICSARTPDDFVRCSIALIPKLVASELTIYGELNPRHKQFRYVTSSDVSFPGGSELYRRYFHQHPFARHTYGGRDGSAVKLSDFLSDRELHALDLYQLVFKRIGFDRETVVWLPAPRGKEVTLALHRKRIDFTEADRQLLNLVRPHLIQAYENAKAFSRMQQDQAQLCEAVDTIADGIVLVTKTGRVRQISRKAEECLRSYFGRRKGDSLPSQLAIWLASQTSDVAEGSISNARSPYLVSTERGSLTIRLIDGEPALLVLEERAACGDASQLQHLGLTRREAEVLYWIASGKTNDAIAIILSISHHTVARHVEAILRKLNVESRTAAAGIAFGVLHSRERTLCLPPPQI